MGVGQSNVQVTVTENGWIYTKTVGEKTTQVKLIDENKNGTPDAKDKKVVLSMDAGDFTTTEFNEATKSVFAEKAKQGETIGDWYKRKSTEEQEEARAEAFARQQRQQRMAQYEAKGKKNNFWNKTAMFLGALCGFGGGFFSNGWQYNGGSFNDWNVRLFSTGVNGLSMTSNMLESTYGNQLNATNYMTGGSTNMFGSDFFSQMMSAQNAYLQNKQEQFEQTMEALTKAQETQRQTNESKATAEKAKSLYEKYEKADEKEIETTNKAKLNEIYQPTKKAEEYTAEEKATDKKITEYTPLQNETIDNEKDTKLSTQVAEQINKLIAGYRSYAMPDAVEDKVITKSDYDSLIGIINKAQNGTLTEADIKQINDILKANTSKLKES